MRRSTIIAIALIIAIGIPLIPLAVILWPSPQTQVPDQPQQSASIFLKGNEAIDAYFIEDLGDGLSWTTAYTLAYISVDGYYANSSIRIIDSTRYLIIKNCSVMHGGTEYNGGAGIIIENSTHVKIANTSVMYNGGWGILLNNSQE